jgi:TolB-like protein
MVQQLSCPDLPDLLHFDLGILDEGEAEALEQHLASCPGCLTRLSELGEHRPSDTLLDAMRAQETVVERPVLEPRVQELMSRLKQLPPALASATPSPSQTPAPEVYDFLAPALLPGELGRLGPYRILSVLGSGGMGVVFLAEDSQLQRRVALKALHPALAASASARRRFLREAQAAAAVEHDHLVPIYQVSDERGVPYLAMQVLQGETLEERLVRQRRLPIPEVLRIGQEIADGLAAAHGRGLIHRDIKPANIWLERKEQDSSPVDRVKILDFGLARPAGDDSGLTHPGTFVGTPLYGSPEQASGGSVDHRCDLFSLGSVLYALCAGQSPFAAGSNLAVLRRVCEDTPRPVQQLNPEVPAGLAAIIARLLAKNPAQRYASAAEVAALLGHERNKLGQPTAPAQARPRAAETMQMKAPRKRRSRWLVAAGVFLAPLLALGLAEATGNRVVRPLISALFPGAVPESQAEAGSSNAPGAGQDDPPGEAAPAAVVYPTALFAFEERGGSKGVAAKITDLLFAKLATRPELMLVDRDDLKKTFQELELNLSGMVKEPARVGQLTGARLLVSGSVVQVDKKLYLTARIVGTETSRLAPVAVEGKLSDELGPLVDKLATAVGDKIAQEGKNLVAAPLTRTDRLAALSKKLKDGKRPTVMIQIAERHVGPVVHDPAAQTELIRYCRATGFTVLDSGAPVGQADVLIQGEGISELAGRRGGLTSVKARVELKVVDRKTDKILAADRQTTVVVDVTEQIASKTALEQAAAALAERLLPKLVKTSGAPGESK